MLAQIIDKIKGGKKKPPATKEGFFLYGTRGGLDQVWGALNDPESSEIHASIKDALDFLIGMHHGYLKIDDLSISYYTYDARIKRHVYMICTKVFGPEKYKEPVFVAFMVSTREESNECI